MTSQVDVMSKFQAEQDTRKARRIDRHTVSAIAVFVLCVVLILASRLVSPSLGSWQQVLTVLTLASFLVVLSFGQGLVILTGGLDLSLPAVITLGGVLTTTWIGNGPGAWYMLPFVLAICGGVGLASAIGIVWLKVPPFIMTMATSIIVSSAALGLTNGTPRGASPDVLLLLMKGSWLGIPAPVYFLVIFAVVGWIVQSRTVFGRYLYALGTNRDAARIAGVPITLVSVLPYVISAVCAGFVGMMLVGYANGATLRMGDNYMLPSIAAVVIGGSSILGGNGNFAGTVGGAILLTTVGTVIAAIGLEQGLRTIIEGGIILVALLLLREELFERLRGLSGKPRSGG
ncbi:ABC transporter permease [Metarhizobium album]|uniref:Autoinducer 2 import system permease protein LsrD n=1 Tax=Metarhizobium album TaxID=2182425 RepID=A0A2U2DR69_9HYPH|nr:ABC transporter permease [Rhizobium album]PWE55813.1 ABC transporter permease [Rhizobium album]